MQLLNLQIEEIKASLQQNIGITCLLQQDKALQLLLERVEKFNWEMSAAGFFKVNRSLISGVTDFNALNINKNSNHECDEY